MGGNIAFNENDDIQLKGASNGTLIGNVGDRLKVDSSLVGNQAVADNRFYSVTANVVMATSGVDNPLILMRNPTGSGRVLRIWKVIGGTTVANVQAAILLYAAPTITSNGTVLASANTNVGGGAGVASALLTTLPTISVLGSPLMGGTMGQNNSSVLISDRYEVYVQANSAVLITGNPASNNRNALLTLSWYEV